MKTMKNRTTSERNRPEMECVGNETNERLKENQIERMRNEMYGK